VGRGIFGFWSMAGDMLSVVGFPDGAWPVLNVLAR